MLGMGVFMGGSRQGDGSRRYARITAAFLVMLALVGCAGLGLLPYRSYAQKSAFTSYTALESAYRAVQPGTTLASDLGHLGFSVTGSSNVQVLSYLGVIERFMPKNSIRFDRLAPAVRACIDARDRCTGYIFRVSKGAAGTAGNLLSLIGEPTPARASGWPVEVVLLVQNGRIAYKAMLGRRG